MNLSTRSGFSDWFTPKGVAQVGIPAAMVAFLLAVMTGYLKTPLMDGIWLIPLVRADQVAMTAQHALIIDYFNRALDLQKAQCDNEAETREEFQRCAAAYRPLISSQAP